MRWGWPAAIVGTLGVLLVASARRPSCKKERSRLVRPNLPVDTVKRLVVAAARGANVPQAWALAWVSIESGFQDAVVGDRDWPFRPEKYERYVLGNPAYARNPYRECRAVWASYGLTQLLAPHFLDRAIEAGLLPADAHPEELSDAEVNLSLGMPMIASLYRVTGGDFGWARGIAVGCLRLDGHPATSASGRQQCSNGYIAGVLDRNRAALQRWT